MANFERSGFQVASTWFFHTANPWIDVTYQLKYGWSDGPQTVEFCFPFAIKNPTYRYDAPGAILIAGPKKTGGDDLPGANPQLYAGVTFAAASGGDRTALIITPDSLLLRFGQNTSNIPTNITSMPMMNLTGNDHQFVYGRFENLDILNGLSQPHIQNDLLQLGDLMNVFEPKFFFQFGSDLLRIIALKL